MGFCDFSHFFHDLLFPDSLEPPKFVKKLEASKIVKAGDSTRLECKITGSPEIRVVWYRNEHELTASDKYQMTFIDSVAVIQMNGLGTEDSGDFILEAQNPAGSTSCSTKVIVKGRILLLFVINRNPSPSSPLGITVSQATLLPRVFA